MIYVAIIADIINSRQIDERGTVQQKLENILTEINKEYKSCIAAGFRITRGDEFEGLLSSAEALPAIIHSLKKKLYPVKARFGVGIGAITTDIKKDVGKNDGPAFYAAREALEKLEDMEKKTKGRAVNILICQYGSEDFEVEQINLMIEMQKNIEDQWTDKQRLTIFDMEENGGSQTECAKRLGTTQSTVARRLAEGNFLLYEKAHSAIKESVKRYWNKLN